MIGGDKVGNRLHLEVVKKFGDKREFVCFQRRRTVEKVLEAEEKRLCFDELVAELFY
jgi:hypothetical protein